MTESGTSTASNLALALFMAGVCAVAALIGGRWMLAEYYAFRTENQMAAWTANREVVLAEWEAANAELQRSIELHATRSESYYVQGLMHEMRATQPYPIDPALPQAEQEAELLQLLLAEFQDAASAYRKALALRPTWPEIWVRLLSVKGILGELDDEFSDAYLKLFQYGKNKNEMLLPLTYASLQFFLPLQDKAETQALQVGHFARVLSAANAAPHVDLMRQSGLLPFICADLAARGYTLSPYSTQACTAAAAQAAQ